jgi:WhiB family transcriptional regulator, redox-sensing transcriptional regulator
MEWRLQAACLGHNDPELWHDPDLFQQARAVEVCRQCPVTADCLAYADRHGDSHGVWGGMTPRERRARAVKPAVLARTQLDLETVGALFDAAADAAARGMALSALAAARRLPECSASRAATIRRYAPELEAEVRAGRMTLTAAYEQVLAIKQSMKEYA